MKTANIIEGLTILEKYRDDKDGYNIGGEHDTIYAYATKRPLSDDDLERMISLGWSQESWPIESCGYTEEFNSTHYDIEESWYANV